MFYSHHCSLTICFCYWVSGQACQRSSKRLWNLPLQPFSGFSCLQLQGQVCAITHTQNHSVFCTQTPSKRATEAVLHLCTWWRWVLLRGFNIISVTVVLRNPMETRSELTGSYGWDAFQSPSPFGPGTHSHELLLKLVWEQCKGGRMTSKHPAEEHGPWPFSSAHTHTDAYEHT